MTEISIVTCSCSYGLMKAGVMIATIEVWLLFNGTNPRSIMVVDNASIHHIDEIAETQAGAKLCYRPPYSPDLNPTKGMHMFSQAKSMNDKLIQATTAPRAMLAKIFGMISMRLLWSHLSLWTLLNGYHFCLRI